jgi:hypothetical protein
MAVGIGITADFARLPLQPTEALRKSNDVIGFRDVRVVPLVLGSFLPEVPAAGTDAVSAKVLLDRLAGHDATASRSGNRSSIAQPKKLANLCAFSTVTVWKRFPATSVT